jgi:hypothetical protein
MFLCRPYAGFYVSMGKDLKYEVCADGHQAVTIEAAAEVPDPAPAKGKGKAKSKGKSTATGASTVSSGIRLENVSAPGLWWIAT